MEKQERLTQAFNYLRDKGLAHTQKDVSDRMGASASNVSSAFNGDERFLTDNFLKRFNRAYDSIFSLRWLLVGEGQMLDKQDCITQNVRGNGNNFTTKGDVTNNGTSNIAIEKAFEEVAEMRKLLTEAVQNNIAITNRLMTLLETLTQKLN